MRSVIVLFRDQRRAQATGGTANCITVNITSRGAETHGIGPKDLCEVIVRDDGVLIRKHPGNEETDGSST